jgi:transcription initiation factor TFIIIB Brf1 subunit/transcription initiation factor TFIIB
MRYGVIVCPKCRRAKGVDVSHKTTRCPCCGKVLTLKNLDIKYKTNSEEDLRRAIGLVNAENNGKIEEFKRLYSR